MLKFVSGDLFDFEAEIRVNTVNCVGVMGKGVALAFKQRYPEMFRDYKETCDRGEVNPGQMHTFTAGDGTLIINFPTKRHWRSKSRYDDVEDGLKAFKELLANQNGKRVTLPALGCGHGGLEWSRVSEMIRNYLSESPAEVLVFEPSASKRAGTKPIDETTKLQLDDQGITALGETSNLFPQNRVSLIGEPLYAKGRVELLGKRFVAMLCPHSPTEREVAAASVCAEELAKHGVTIATGFDVKIERKILRSALMQGGNVVVGLATGLLDFKIPSDLKDVWDDARVVLLSTSAANKWSANTAKGVTKAMVSMSNSVLIADPNPQNWQHLFEHFRQSDIGIGYIDYQIAGSDSFGLHLPNSIAVRKNKDTGKPNVEWLRERAQHPESLVSNEDRAQHSQADSRNNGQLSREDLQQIQMFDAKAVSWSGIVDSEDFERFFASVIQRLRRSDKFSIHFEVSTDDEITGEKVKDIFGTANNSPSPGSSSHGVK